MRTALVTGAAGGIGQALCKRFRAAGHRVVGTDLKRARNCDAFVAADLERFAIDADYANQQVHALREATGKRLDVLVNNAAVQRLGATADVTRDDWEATLHVNLTAPFLLTQALLPELRAAKGCVINISSIHAKLTKPGFVAYATSKAALSGLTRAMAVDLGPLGVRVNAIEPAAVATPLLRAGLSAKALKQLEEFHPTENVGMPAEVAALALAIASGPAFLTGSVVGLDGGIRARLHDPE